MANQIIVTDSGNVQVAVSPPANVQVQISRAVIGTVANVESANYAAYAGNVVNASQPNITTVGTLGNLNVANTLTTQDLVVTGNFSVGNLVANNANYANFAGIANTANTVAGANVTGTVANATFATTAGTANSATVAASANSVAGANVTGTVANATYAVSAGTANTANSATVAASANSVSLANVSGAGNIASINLDGSSSNVLYGNGVFAPAAGGNTANANYANFAGTAFSVSGSNVSGAVANATYANSANTANSATVAASANSVAGANVSGTVANANVANNVTILQDFGNANSQYITYVGANTSGNQQVKVDLSLAYIPNTNILSTNANGGFHGKLLGANTATPNSFVSVAGASGNITANVNGTTRLTISANGANINGNITATNLGNIVSVNLDGNVSNVLSGNGTFVALPTVSANANYANFAGQVVDATQSNITSVGNLVSLQVGNNAANITTTKFVPAGANITTLSGDIFVNNTRISNDDADTLANGVLAQDAIINPYDSANVVGQPYVVNYLTQDLANTANIATAGTDTFNMFDYGAGNAASVGQRVFSFYTPDSDLATANPNTTLDVNIGDGGLFINRKMPNDLAQTPGAGIIDTMNYGEVSDPTSATGIRFQRRRGNNSGGTSTRDPVVAGDYLGNIAWRGAGTATGTINSGTATIGAKVDSSYGGPGNVMPIGMELSVIDSSNALISHNFYANGDVNISGNISATNMGNIVSVNLDGNSSNLLDGTGNFVAIPTSVANANYANFAGDVVNASQSNITSLGNLVLLQVGNNAANITTTTFTPVGANITTLSGDIFVNNKRVSNDDADVLANGTSTSDAIINPYDTGNGSSQSYVMNYLVQDLATPSNIAIAGTDTFSMFDYVAGDMASTGDRTLALYTRDSDLASANPNTTLNFVQGGSGLLINRQMPNDLAAIAGSGLLGMMNYGEAGDPADATGILMQRRRGNNSGGTSTRDPVVADDYLGNIAWRGAGTATGSINSGRAVFGAKVDSSYGGPGTVMPIGMEMTVIDSSNAQLTHSFYANGDVSFAGNIISTLPPATSIANGNSSVSFTGAGGDLNITIDNTQYATFYNNRRLELSGIEADSGNASQLVLDNGGIQLLQEDLGGGFASFDFKSYFSTGFIAPYTFYRARGNTASPNNVQSGDAIKTESYIVYGDSGNTFVNVGTYSATVTANDNAGNVQSRIEIATNRNDNGSEVKLNADVVVLEGNSAINLNANTNMGSGSLFKLASFTASALTAITGSIGQMAAVSDSGGGSNPNGMIAFWDTTNSRWSYVHDNSAV